MLKTPSKKWGRHILAYQTLKRSVTTTCSEAKKDKITSRLKISIRMNYSDKCSKDKASTKYLGKLLHIKEWAIKEGIQWLIS